MVPALGRLVGLSLLVGCSALTVAEEPTVRLSVERETGIARIVARNSEPVPVTVRLELTVRENVQLDQTLPRVVTVPAGGQQTVLVLERDDPTLPWRYRYRWSWTEGALEEEPPPAATPGRAAVATTPSATAIATGCPTARYWHIMFLFWNTTCPRAR